MLLLSYGVNLLVLVPLLASFAASPAGMDPVFGPDTDARRILICVYAAIALMSAGGLALMVAGRPDLALGLGVSLFAMQVVYKLLTVVLVGLSSPVVLTNVVVVAVHVATLFVLVPRVVSAE